MEIGELLERELCLGELLDIVRLGQEENQSEQILEVEERGQRQILEEQIINFYILHFKLPFITLKTILQILPCMTSRRCRSSE